jgi:two-component system response regulator AtoC
VARILLAEDDEIMRITIQDRLRKNKWHVDAVPNGKKASERLKKGNYHLVISDIRMPGFDGWQLLDFVRKSVPNTDIIMMTAFCSVDDAIESLKKGATDYILKPFNMDDLVFRISRILEMQTIKARCVSLEENCRVMHSDLIGKSKALEHTLGLIKQVAPTDSTVLILGESGTGKELVANSIHMQSKRASKPFVRINCAAIPEGLMESELFGHEKGAFTGAHAKKLGKFEMADSGSMLLDEIGEMPLSLQAKLLRVLEENMYERVGGTSTIQVDVRILCATSRDLEKAVDSGNFRQDLYYRLNVIPIQLPPLRERKEDIPILTNHFLNEFSADRGMVMGISPEALQSLIDYDFPGNIRELKNIIERCSVLAQDQIIQPQDLPSDIAAGNVYDDREDSFSLSNAMAKTEKQLILKALAHTEGKKGEAAELLGISRKNLWEKIKLYQIT